MGVIKINTSQPLQFANAYMRANAANHPTLDWGLPGVHFINQSGYNDQYDLDNPPFSVPSGFEIDSTGVFIMPPTEDPVIKFTVKNLDATHDIFVGINVETSGGWSIDDGFPLVAGASFEFGGDDTQPIRNVWGIGSVNLGASTGLAIDGYATNFPNRL